jgi:flagellar basal-body rod protein FlgB
MEALGRMAPLVGALLDAATLRHRVVAENLANSETPGYRARGVRFDQALERAVAGGDVDAAEGAHAELFDRGGRVKSDGNDVDLEVEVGEMNRNALAYQTLLQVASGKQRLMRAAVAGRGG